MKVKVVYTIIGILIGICLLNYVSSDEKTSNDPPRLEDLIGVESGSKSETYLKNGDFYSSDKTSRFGIDTSYIDKLEFSLYWYDKVISEFPKSDDAKTALKSKMFALVGWTEGYGDDKKYIGLLNESKSPVYFKMIEQTYNQLKSQYPDDKSISGFAYQIAQAYLYHIVLYGKREYKENLKAWLIETIKTSGGEDTFYSHIAKHRLEWLGEKYGN